MNSVTSRLEIVRSRIQAAEALYDRSPGSVKLIAVSKKQPVEAIQEAIAAGQRVFAENYLQDALPKLIALQGENLEWHFIGDIQSNKTRDIAQHFDWVHTVNREKIARRLNDARTGELPPLNVCLQVNISGETSKAGCHLSELLMLAAVVNNLPNLKLRGLMAIPAATDGFEAQCKPFHALRIAFEQLIEQGFTLDTLSMGMSGDMEAAIAEGATQVRIGTDIFGPRQV